MTAVPDPMWQFDHLDPGLPAKMNEMFAQLRGNCPVAHSDRHGGFWAVLRHADVAAIQKDPATFSSATGVTLPKVVQDLKQPPIDFDPPEHTAYRRIVQRHFTRGAVSRYEPVLRELAAGRIAELVAEGGGDLVAGLGRFLPLRAIAIILGLPAEDGETISRWTTGIFRTAASGDKGANRQVMQEFRAYLAEQIERQRRSGVDSVLTAVADGRVGDRPLTPEEQIGMLVLLVLAGHETTVNGIGTMLYLIATVEGLRERLLADPGLVAAMVDETLRFESPVVAMARRVTRDTELSGQPLASGAWVMAVMSAANRDPEVFEQADEFACPRRPSPHLTFGSGVHRCVGEHLALLEMRVVAEEMLRLAPHYRIVDGYRPDWVGGRITRGLNTLPARFAEA